MTTQPFKDLVLDLVRQSQASEEAFWQGMSANEREAIGTWKLWSAKDHIAHRTFWRQDLNRKLSALVQQQVITSTDTDEEHLNATTYEKQRQCPWSDIQADSVRSYAELTRLTEQISEDDLTSTRFPAISGKHPLYTTFFGALYEREHEHLAQYHAEHHDLARAIEVREKCVSALLQAEVPEWVKGWFLYNLACFYAQHNEIEKATACLQEALTSAPDLAERSKSDPDLAALRA